VQAQTHDVAVEAAKGTPAIVGAMASMVTLNEMVAIATGTYILIQAAYLIRKWWREERAWARREAAEFKEDPRFQLGADPE
jgi:hypothetical protein